MAKRTKEIKCPGAGCENGKVQLTITETQEKIKRNCVVCNGWGKITVKVKEAR